MKRRGSGAASALLVAVAACGGDPVGEPLEVTVPRGAGLGEVTDTLASRGIIERPWLFRAYTRVRGDEGNLRAGRYAFQAGTGWGRIVDDLVNGRVQIQSMTVPEGFAVRQMIPRMAAVAEIPMDSVRAVLESDSLLASLDVPGPGLEGYLFPDTYHFDPGTPVERIVEAMVARYKAYWTEQRRAALARSGLTENEAVTLASIVQAEARRVEEMPRIASVYHNRLDRGFRLQADPTVLYALGGPRERLLYAAIDSVADNPYNTYRQRGLPPGPIAAPGERALDAVLHPDETDLMYFVARPDGSHVFTRTLREHNRAKIRARREWDTASAPQGPEGPEASADSASSEGEPPPR